MRNVEEVALYALLLREAALNHHTSIYSVCDDSDCEHHDCLSFASLLAVAHFTELDWELADLLCNRPDDVVGVAKILYGEHEQPLEAEALLHAHGPNGKKSYAQWAVPIRERWRQVRDSMRAYEQEGLTATTAQLNELVTDVFKEQRPLLTDEDLQILFEEDPRAYDHRERKQYQLELTRAVRHFNTPRGSDRPLSRRWSDD
jgi:hypothetical protein